MEKPSSFFTGLTSSEMAEALYDYLDSSSIEDMDAYLYWLEENQDLTQMIQFFESDDTSYEGRFDYWAVDTLSVYKKYGDLIPGLDGVDIAAKWIDDGRFYIIIEE